MYLKTIKILIVMLLTAVCLPSEAQKITFSPYSRYGVGDIFAPQMGHNLAVGGTGIGKSSEVYLNLLNPAANNNLPLQRFIFDVGMETKYTNVSSSSASQRNNNTTFKYLAGGFAAKPWWSFTFALRPYSSVGYSMKDTLIMQNGTDDLYYGFTQSTEGSGGLNTVTLSTSFKLFKMISIGATGSCLFGSLDRTNQVNVIATDANYSSALKYKNRYLMHGFGCDFGAHFQKSFKSPKDSTKNMLTVGLGVTVGTDTKLKSRNELLILNQFNYISSSTVDTICNDTLTKSNVTLPKKIGVGASVDIYDRLSITADYAFQDWTNFDLEGENNAPLRKSTFLAAGVEYVTDRYSTRFFKTIMYRVGFHTEDTYLELNGTTIKNQGMTFGLGLPLRSILLNIGCDMGKRGTTSNNLYEEKYFLLHFNVTIHDVWFVKRKFQ
ncbi:MAG: hypothetical protein J6V76_00865 [Bacteroidales bacterium]|nr:hypothetical protein [Bacteroidales bacterium]